MSARATHIREVLERAAKLIDEGVRTARLVELESFVCPSLAMTDAELEQEWSDERLVASLKAFVEDAERRGFGAVLTDFKPKRN